MRMHFRPRLASDARAGAVLGAIFDAALESRYRHLLRPSRSGFQSAECNQTTINVSAQSPGLPRSEVRRQRTIKPSLSPIFVEAPF